MPMDDNGCTVKGVLFDFGGVMAEEGFRKGLAAIAEKNGKDPREFFDTAVELIKDTGYLTGDNDENASWRKLRLATGVQDTDESMRGEILTRFVVRDWMLAAVDALRLAGLAIGMLSDQTNWLDELDQKSGFMRHFDVIINSYHFGKSKYDASIFPDAARDLGLAPVDVLFIDDTKQHIDRARAQGMQTLHFNFGGPEAFFKALKQFFPSIEVNQA